MGKILSTLLSGRPTFISRTTISWEWPRHTVAINTVIRYRALYTLITISVGRSLYK